MTKQLMFSVTDKDCDWSFARGSGKGGQKRNKTSTAARCKHRESGAVGFSDDTRSQGANKKIAFQKMAKTREFAEWHTAKLAEMMGTCLGSDLRVEVGR